jgi:hypothetical protein
MEINEHTRNEEELPDQWKESIIVSIHKKGDKTDCNNYRWISLLSTSCKIVFNILLSRLKILVCEAIGTAATPGLLCQARVIVKMIVEK